MVKIYKLSTVVFYNREDRGIPSHIIFTPLHMHAEVINVFDITAEEANTLLHPPKQTAKRYIGANKGYGAEQAIIGLQAGTVASLTEGPEGKIKGKEAAIHSHKGLGGTAHFHEEAYKKNKHSGILGMGAKDSATQMGPETEYLFWEGYKRSVVSGKTIPTAKYNISNGGEGLKDIVSLFNQTLPEADSLAVGYGTLYVTEEAVGRVFCGAENLQTALSNQKKYGGNAVENMRTGHIYHILELGKFAAHDFHILPIDALYLRNADKNVKEEANHQLVYCSNRMPEALRKDVVSIAKQNNGILIKNINEKNTHSEQKSHLERLKSRYPVKNIGRFP